jgi:hypothetical protein
MEERDELLEQLTIHAAFARLVLGVIAQRTGGELRLSRAEIESFDQRWEIDQYVDQKSGELVLRVLSEVQAEAIREDPPPSEPSPGAE